jgi:hypothetical protein
MREFGNIDFGQGPQGSAATGTKLASAIGVQLWATSWNTIREGKFDKPPALGVSI